MALFTDGTISAAADLLAYESGILEVARTEGIDLAAKLSLAQQEIAIALEAQLAQQGGADFSGPANPGPKNVVVTEPLRKWHTFQALALVFRDAQHNQLNERYSAKRKEYERLAKWAADALWRTGAGMVATPVAQAKRPELSSIPGPLPAATYFVRTAGVSRSGEEGSPSEVAAFSSGEGSLLVVTPGDLAEGATGWNVYVGLTQTGLRLQNEAVLPAGHAWTEPASGLRHGREPGTGQGSQWYARTSGMLQRG
jgi:hypothetical protein